MSYVACLKIHRPGASTRGEDSHASLAADVVLPLIRIRMPVQFAQSARLQLHNCRRNRRHGEVLRVDDLHFAGRCYFARLYFLRAEVEAPSHHTGSLRRLILLVLQIRRKTCLKDVRRPLRHFVECRCRYVEVLREYVLGRVCHPVRNQESLEFIEIAIVEDEQKLASVWAQTLNRMRHSWWEEPKVALPDVVDKASTPVIH